MNSDVRFRKLSNMGGDEPFKSYGMAKMAFTKAVVRGKVCKWVKILLLLDRHGYSMKKYLLSFVNTSGRESPDNIENLTYSDIIKYDNTNKDVFYSMMEAGLIAYKDGEKRLVSITNKGKGILRQAENEIINQLFNGDEGIYEKKLNDWLSKKFEAPYEAPSLSRKEAYAKIKEFVSYFEKYAKFEAVDDGNYGVEITEEDDSPYWYIYGPKVHIGVKMENYKGFPDDAVEKLDKLGINVPKKFHFVVDKEYSMKNEILFEIFASNEEEFIKNFEKMIVNAA